MPLKPSGQTPTSSPPDSIRSASSLQASVAPPLRASELTTGSLKTRSAPSGRRKRPVWSCTVEHRHQAVERHGAGVVGDHERAALGGDVLQPADLEPEPLLGDRPQRGHEEPLGELAVEAVVVDLVVALEPAAHERHQLGEAALPVGRRRPPARRPGRPPASRRPGCRRWATAVASSAVVGSRVGLGGERPAARSASAGRRRRWWPAWRPAWRRLAASAAALLGAALRAAGARLRAAEDGRALPEPRPGRPPVPIGMTTASSPSRRRASSGTAGSLQRRRARARRQKSANASAVVNCGSKPSIGAHPGGVHAATVGQEAQLLGREVRRRGPGACVEPSRPTAKRGQGDRRRAEAAYGLASASAPRRRRR